VTSSYSCLYCIGLLPDVDIHFIGRSVKMAYSTGAKNSGFCDLIKERKFSTIYHTTWCINVGSAKQRNINGIMTSDV